MNAEKQKRVLEREVPYDPELEKLFRFYGDLRHITDGKYTNEARKYIAGLRENVWEYRDRVIDAVRSGRINRTELREELTTYKDTTYAGFVTTILWMTANGEEREEIEEIALLQKYGFLGFKAEKTKTLRKYQGAFADIDTVDDAFFNALFGAKIGTMNDGHGDSAQYSKIETMNDGHDDTAWYSKIGIMNDGHDDTAWYSKIGIMNDGHEFTAWHSEIKIMNDGHDRIAWHSEIKIMNDGHDKSAYRAKIDMLLKKHDDAAENAIVINDMTAKENDEQTE